MSFATFRIGAAARLVRALDRHAAAHGLSLTALGHEERAWASATFAGRRLQLTFAIDAARDGAADRWLAALPQAELPVRGAFVAELVVIRRAASGVTLAILLIDDD